MNYSLRKRSRWLEGWGGGRRSGREGVEIKGEESKWEEEKGRNRIGMRRGGEGQEEQGWRNLLPNLEGFEPRGLVACQHHTNNYNTVW